MALTSTEKWTERNSETSYTGATAARYFQVTGPLAELADDKKVELAPGIPKLGQSHKKRRDLRVTNIIAGPGLAMREVTVYYSIIVGEFVTGASNPLTQPPMIEWTNAGEMQSRTRDLLGNPIANSAGILFDPPLSEFTNWFHLEIRRWEPRFDFVKSRKFFNCVNSREMSSGGISFPAHTIRCLSIMPAEPFAANDQYVNMSYKFDVRLPTRKNNASKIEEHPHQLWLQDVGLTNNLGERLYTKVGATVGQPVEEPVPLQLGVPTGDYVNERGQSPTKQKLPNGVEYVLASGVWYLGFQVFPEADLLDLRL